MNVTIIQYEQTSKIYLCTLPMGKLCYSGDRLLIEYDGKYYVAMSLSNSFHLEEDSLQYKDVLAKCSNTTMNHKAVGIFNYVSWEEYGGD